MSKSIWVDDGYTETKTYQVADFPPFEVVFRPVVGVARAQWLHRLSARDKAGNYDLAAVRKALSELLAAQVVSVNGATDLTAAAFDSLDDACAGAIQTDVLRLPTEADAKN